MENLFVIYVTYQFRSIDKKENFRGREGSWEEGLFNFLQESKENPRKFFWGSLSQEDYEFGTESTLREVIIP